MTKKSTTTDSNSPRTIKVSTLIIATLVLLGLVASFIGGTIYANNYNSTVEAKALEKVSEIELKLQKQ